MLDARVLSQLLLTVLGVGTITAVSFLTIVAATAPVVFELHRLTLIVLAVGSPCFACGVGHVFIRSGTKITFSTVQIPIASCILAPATLLLTIMLTTESSFTDGSSLPLALLSWLVGGLVLCIVWISLVFVRNSGVYSAHAAAFLASAACLLIALPAGALLPGLLIAKREFWGISETSLEILIFILIVSVSGTASLFAFALLAGRFHLSHKVYKNTATIITLTVTFGGGTLLLIWAWFLQPATAVWPRGNLQIFACTLCFVLLGSMLLGVCFVSWHAPFHRKLCVIGWLLVVAPLGGFLALAKYTEETFGADASPPPTLWFSMGLATPVCAVGLLVVAALLRRRRMSHGLVGGVLWQAFVALPVGIFLPIYLSKAMDEPVVLLIIAIGFPAAAASTVLLERLASLIGFIQRWRIGQRHQKNESGSVESDEDDVKFDGEAAPDIEFTLHRWLASGLPRVSASITHAVMILAMSTCAVLVVHGQLAIGGLGTLLMVMILAPFSFYLGLLGQPLAAQRERSRRGRKNVVAAACCLGLLLPLMTAVVTLVIGAFRDENNVATVVDSNTTFTLGMADLRAALYVSLLAPLASLGWLFVYGTRRMFPLTVRPEVAGPLSTSLCCIFAFLPFGVLLPISNALEVSLIEPQHFVMLALLLAMCGVAVISVGLNNELRRMQKEKQAKLACFRLRKALRKVAVKLDAALARVLWDEYIEEAKQFRSSAMAFSASGDDLCKAKAKAADFFEMLLSEEFVMWVDLEPLTPFMSLKFSEDVRAEEAAKAEEVARNEAIAAAIRAKREQMEQMSEAERNAEKENARITASEALAAARAKAEAENAALALEVDAAARSAREESAAIDIAALELHISDCLFCCRSRVNDTISDDMCTEPPKTYVPYTENRWTALKIVNSVRPPRLVPAFPVNTTQSIEFAVTNVVHPGFEQFKHTDFRHLLTDELEAVAQEIGVPNAHTLTRENLLLWIHESIRKPPPLAAGHSSAHLIIEQKELEDAADRALQATARGNEARARWRGALHTMKRRRRTQWVLARMPDAIHADYHDSLLERIFAYYATGPIVDGPHGLGTEPTMEMNDWRMLMTDCRFHRKLFRARMRKGGMAASKSMLDLVYISLTKQHTINNRIPMNFDLFRTALSGLSRKIFPALPAHKHNDAAEVVQEVLHHAHIVPFTQTKETWNDGNHNNVLDISTTPRLFHMMRREVGPMISVEHGRTASEEQVLGSDVISEEESSADHELSSLSWSERFRQWMLQLLPVPGEGADGASLLHLSKQDQEAELDSVKPDDSFDCASKAMLPNELKRELTPLAKMLYSGAVSEVKTADKAESHLHSLPMNASVDIEAPLPKASSLLVPHHNLDDMGSAAYSLTAVKARKFLSQYKQPKVRKRTRNWEQTCEVMVASLMLSESATRGEVTSSDTSEFSKQHGLSRSFDEEKVTVKQLGVSMAASSNLFAILNIFNECIGLAFVALVMWPPNPISAWTTDFVETAQTVAEAWLFEAGNSPADVASAVAAAAMLKVNETNATVDAAAYAMTTNTNTTVPFAAYFWCSVAISLLYPIYAIHGIKLAQQHRLGYDPRTGKKAAFGSRPWFYVFGLSVAGNSLYMQVLKTLVAVLVCDYETGALARDATMLCWSLDHIVYISIAALAALCYYPVSTFLFPNFQFADKSLDLKFEPSFLVVVGQARLLLSGVAAFSNSEAVALPLVCAICIFLAFISWHMAPCLIHKVNPWRAGGYAMAAWASIATFVRIYIDSEDGTMAAVILFGGWALLLIALFEYHKRSFGMRLCGYTIGSSKIQPLVSINSMESIRDIAHSSLKRPGTLRQLLA